MTSEDVTAAQVADDVAELTEIATSIVGRGYERFVADDSNGKILRKAARQVVTDLAAATGRLSDDVRSRHPEIPWHDIAATRNYVAHAYDHVDDDIIWSALDGEIRRVADALAAYRDKT